MSTETPQTDRNVTAFFDKREAAEEAISQVVETGLPREKILLRAGAARKAAFVEDGKGLLQEVKELILPSEEPDAVVEALKHEGFLLSIRPEPDAHDAMVELLERAGGQCIESREDIWPDWKSGHCDSRQDEYPEGATSDDSTDAGPVEASTENPPVGSVAEERPGSGEPAPPAVRQPAEADQATAPS